MKHYKTTPEIVLGDVPAIVIPEIQVTYDRSTGKQFLGQISSSYDVADFIRRTFKNDIELQEQFIVLYLNQSNHIIGYYKHSRGAIAATIADIRIILGVALRSCSPQILCSHNHPSGAPRKRIGVIYKTFISMLGVNIVDTEAGAKTKATLLLKPSRNVVNGCPTIQRTAIQSNTMATQETVDRCPDGWNTRSKIGIECSYRNYFTDGNSDHGRVRMDATPFIVFIPDSGRENVSCKGYRQCLQYYVDDTDVNLGTVSTSLSPESRRVCSHMVETGRSSRSSPSKGKPCTGRRGTVRFNAMSFCELNRRKDVWT
jgi:hypothetical protein